MKNKIEQWFKRHKFHVGKWSLVGHIAKDLNLETFECGLPFWYKTYPWNNEVAKVLNELSKEGKIRQGVQGRAYRYDWNDEK